MFCTQCGAKLPDGARFCTNCGAAVAPKAADEVPTPVSPVPAEPASDDPGETVVTLDAVDPQGTANAGTTTEAPVDPGETVVTLDGAATDPGETVITLDAANTEPGETVVTLDAENPETAAQAGESQAEPVDPGETVVTLDAAEDSDDAAEEQQDAGDSEPTDGTPAKAEDATVDDAEAALVPVEDAAEAVDASEADAIFEDEDNAAVAVDFPDDDPTTLAEPVASDDATTVTPVDEDAEATAAAMESLGVANPTAGNTVVENPIDMNAYAAQAAQAAQAPAGMTMPQQPLPQQEPIAQQAAAPQQKKKRWPIVAGLGLVAAGAAVAAIMFLAPNANAVEVTSGSQDAVVCTVDTKVLPKKKDRAIHSYTATLIPKNGGKSYKIKVKGDDGFTIGDFGKIKPGNYRCVIETPKGDTVQHFDTTVVKQGGTDKNGNEPAKDVTVKGDSESTDNAAPDTKTDTSASNDQGSNGSTSTDDTTDGSGSSSNNSSSKDKGTTSGSSKKNNANDSSASTDTAQKEPIAPSTIDDATYHAAIKAYKTKIEDLERTYGEPALAATGSGSDYQIGGLQLAQLVDFNGDGLEELVTVHSKTKASTFNKKTRLKNGDYVLDVWTYNGAKLVKLYSGSPQGSNGGYVFVTIEKMLGDTGNHLYLAQHISNGSAVLVSGKKSSDAVECKYFTFDGTEFQAADVETHGDGFDDQSAYLIKGYDTNLEAQDASAPENHIDTSKLNLNDTVDTVESTLMLLETKISSTSSDSDSSSSGSNSSSTSSKSKKSRKSSRSSSSSSSNRSSSSSSSSSDDDYSYDDDDYSYDDSYDDSDSHDDSDDSDSGSDQDVAPTEFTDED